MLKHTQGLARFLNGQRNSLCKIGDLSSIPGVHTKLTSELQSNNNKNNSKNPVLEKQASKKLFSGLYVHCHAIHNPLPHMTYVCMCVCVYTYIMYTINKYMHTINEKLKRIYIIKKLKISKQASMLYLQCFLCYCLRQYYWNPSASALWCWGYRSVPTPVS